MLGPLTNSLNMKYKLYNIKNTHFTHFFQCDNVFALSCFSLISNNANYIIGNRLAYFRDSFAININRCTLNDNIQKIKVSTSISDDKQLTIKTLIVLCS